MVNQNILILRPKFNIFWAIFIRLFLTFNTSAYEQRTTIKKWIADSKGEVEIRDTVVRWIEIPLEYTGKYIPSGLNGNRIYELNELFSLRNKLVHHKAKIFELVNDSNLEDAEDNNYVTLLEAERAVDVVIKAVKALQQIDNDVDLNWLDQ
jgi:hypothetical protein